LPPLDHNILRHGVGMAIVMSGVYGGHVHIPSPSLRNRLGCHQVVIMKDMTMVIAWKEVAMVIAW